MHLSIVTRQLKALCAESAQTSQSCVHFADGDRKHELRASLRRRSLYHLGRQQIADKANKVRMASQLPSFDTIP